MKPPKGLETVERASLHYAAARRNSRQILKEDPYITTPSFAVELHKRITTTRNPEALLRVIAACVANLPTWRRKANRLHLVN